jgi:hypothetical protein
MNLEEIKARAGKVELTMERLTRRGKKNKTWVLINKSCSKADGTFCPHANTCSHVDNRTCPYLEVLDRLCEYEETGMSPAEISGLRSELDRAKKYIEHLQMMAKIDEGESI